MEDNKSTDESATRKSDALWLTLGGILAATLFAIAMAGSPDEQSEVQNKSNTTVRPDKPETEKESDAATNIVGTEETSTAQNTYRSALQCYTLADIVDTMAEEIDKPELRDSGAWRSDWKLAAYEAGKAVGKSESQIEVDYSDEYMRVVGPVRTMAAPQSSEYINSLVRKLHNCGRSPARAVAAGHPDKPAHIVFRDAKIICPVVLKNTKERGGRESAVDLLSFSVQRQYSKSDTKALLRLCSLYAESGSF